MSAAHNVCADADQTNLDESKEGLDSVMPEPSSDDETTGDASSDMRALVPPEKERLPSDIPYDEIPVGR